MNISTPRKHRTLAWSLRKSATIYHTESTCTPACPLERGQRNSQDLCSLRPSETFQFSLFAFA